VARSSIGVKESSVRPATCGPVAVLALVAALTGACSTLKVGSDFDHAASFSGYRTYSWLPRERRGNSNPLTVQRARDAIDSELIAKGFHEASDPQAADFVVDFTIGSHERTDVESYPAAYAGPWWGVRGWAGPIGATRSMSGSTARGFSRSTCLTSARTGPCGTAGQRRNCPVRISRIPPRPSATP